jgi:hypothetical protein
MKSSKVDFIFGVGRDRHNNPIKLHDLLVAIESVGRKAATLFDRFLIAESSSSKMECGEQVRQPAYTITVYVKSYFGALGQVKQLRETIMAELSIENVSVISTEVEEQSFV